MAKDNSLKTFVTGSVLDAPDLNQLTQNLGAISYLSPWDSSLNKDTTGSVFLGTTSAPLAGVVFSPSFKFLTSDGVNTTELNVVGSPVGTIVPSAAITTPDGWLPCNGTAVSRTTYASLFNALTEDKSTFTVTIATPARVTLNNHNMITGDQVSLTTTGALPTGLTASTNYWIVNEGTNNFWLSTTYANALAGTKINTSGSQSGFHSLRYNPYGISGTSNFLVPDLRAATLRGAGTSTAFTQNQTINLGGIQDDQMQGHYHSASAASVSSGYTAGGEPPTVYGAQGGGTVTSPSTDGTNGTPRTGNETRMKNIGVKFIIKY